MPPELWTKLVADAPILAVLLIVLWKGGDKLDKIGEKFDKMTMAVKGLSAKVELIGKLQDVRLDLHEERTTGKHSVVSASVVHGPNGAVPPNTPAWPNGAAADEDD